MRATSNRSQPARSIQRGLFLAIGAFVAVAFSSVVSAQARPFFSAVPAPAPRYDVNLVCLLNDQPLAGAIVAVTSNGITYQNLTSDQWGVVHRPGARPWEPTLGSGAGVEFQGGSPGFLGSNESFHVVAQHPTAGVVVRTFESYAGAGCGDGCTRTSVQVTYRIDFDQEPKLLRAPGLSSDPEPELGGGCKPGETKHRLEYVSLRSEPCRDPNGIPIGCTEYLCGVSPGTVSGGLGETTEQTQTLVEQLSAETRLRLAGFGLRIGGSSTGTESTSVKSSRTNNWSIGAPLADGYKCKSGSVCVRTKVITVSFRKYEDTCERVPATGGTRWRVRFVGLVDVPMTTGTCVDLSGLADDPNCCKKDR